nr:metal ABC transporter substrate-binding protein [Liberibacter crescens]
MTPLSALAKIKVVTTFSIIADMTQNIAGELATVENIIKPGAEVHNYQATPGDILKVQSADLVLVNGLGLEKWFEKFLINLKNVPHATLTKGIQPLSISSGPYQGKPNPHAWMSDHNGFIYIDNICKALIKIDPENSDSYTSNALIYKEKLKKMTQPFRHQIESLPENKRWLVTSEGAFSYLARDFGLKELYLWPVNTDSEGTPQQVRKVIDMVRKHNINVIFSESTVSDKPAQQVALETGAKYGGILYVDSISDKNGPVPTYLDLLKVTVDTIVQGLSS